MLNAITLAVATIGAMISFAAILAQFIGANYETLKTLGLFQFCCLVLAVILANLVYSNYQKISKNKDGQLKRFFLDMPGWLMFTLILMIITALLGDLSVILVRAIGQQVTGLFHLPSVCIVIYAVIYRVVYLNFTAKPGQ